MSDFFIRLQSFAGLLLLALLAWVISENRRGVSWRGTFAGIAVQLALAGIIFTVPVFKDVFLLLNRVVASLWLMGVPWAEAHTAGALMGTKTVLNELIAYVELANLPPGGLSERSRLIMTYAMCGFANFGSLGIMIGGLGSIVPERRQEIISLGMRSIVSGTLATCMTGAVVGIF